MTQWRNSTDQEAASKPEKAKKQFDAIMAQIITQYDTPQNFDSLASADYKVTIAQRKVMEQIKQALKNNDSLAETDEKTKRLTLEAETYDNSSRELKNTMSIRNTKVQLVLGIILLAIGVTILIAIFK